MGHPVEADLIQVVTKCSSIFTLGCQNFGLDFETVVGQDLEHEYLEAEVLPILSELKKWVRGMAILIF